MTNSRASRRSRHPVSPLARAVDWLLALSAIALAAWFALRTPVWGKYDPLVPGATATIVMLGILLSLAGCLVLAVPRDPRLMRWAIRTTSTAMVVAGVAMAISRVRLEWKVEAEPDPWPPLTHLIAAAHVDSLPAVERADWALRLTSHLVVDGDGVTLAPRVPTDWPYPRDAEIAVRQPHEREVDVWVRLADGTTVCESIWLDTDLAADSLVRRQRCGPDVAPPPGLTFAPPLRVASAAVPLPEGPTGTAWTQYRHDPQRSGNSELADTPSSPHAPWRVAIDGPIRASASVSGDLTLIGAHGTGALVAIAHASGETRWIARLPNWIHQDAVTDGRIVVIGFGDNLPSFNGRAPSGVAAYDRATGRHLWTAFDPGSVMTSPIVHRGEIVYGTGSGLLRKRDLRTGRLLDEDTLPGFVTMAPPVRMDGAIVFALDHGITCALDWETLAERWCTDLSDLRKIGHAAPTVAGDLVLVSGAATVGSLAPSDLDDLEPALRGRLLRSAIFPGEYEVYAGQVVVALDAETGEVRWESPIFPFEVDVAGHTSGTATIAGPLAVIALPIADTVVAFHHEDGTIAWTAPGHGARGPPVVIGDHVVLTGRDGVVAVHDLATGTIVCEAQRGIGFDRGGPTLAGGMVILANLRGVVEGVPVEHVVRCRLPGAANGS